MQKKKYEIKKSNTLKMTTSLRFLIFRLNVMEKNTDSWQHLNHVSDQDDIPSSDVGVSWSPKLILEKEKNKNKMIIVLNIKV